MRTTTLFVTDVPDNLPESEFVNIFQNCDGFVTARLRADRNGNVVGFVEFEDQNSASIAKNKYHSYKTSLSDLGLNIRFSHHGVSTKRTRDRDGSGYTPFHSADRAPVPIVMPDGITPFYNPFNVNGYPQPTASYFMQQPFQSNLYTAEASTTLYVEGLPLDATDREVAHIFRPFTGYQSLRILRKEAKQNPARVYNLCFVEFDSKYQATIAMNALNGYRMDKNDTKGLKITYAKSERKGRLSSSSSSSSNVNMNGNNHVSSGGGNEQSSSTHSNNHNHHNHNNDQSGLSPQEISSPMYVPRFHTHSSSHHVTQHHHQNIFCDNHSFE